MARNPKPAISRQFTLQIFDIATILSQRFEGPGKLAERFG